MLAEIIRVYTIQELIRISNKQTNEQTKMDTIISNWGDVSTKQNYKLCSQYRN